MLLGKIVPEHGTMEDFEVEHEFSSLGHRTLCLNARKVFYDVGQHTNILLSIEDVTGRRAADDAKDELLGRMACCSKRPGIAWPTACKSSQP
jgi:chemotaxis protein methyltransferase CheR